MTTQTVEQPLTFRIETQLQPVHPVDNLNPSISDPQEARQKTDRPLAIKTENLTRIL